jgi:hypothetical protein
MKLGYITFLMGLFVIAQAVSRVSKGQSMPWEGDK